MGRPFFVSMLNYFVMIGNVMVGSINCIFVIVRKE